MTTISFRLNDQENELIRRYAQLKNMRVSDVVRLSTIEKIEDEIDLDHFRKAFYAYKKDSTTYTHEQVLRELALD